MIAARDGAFHDPVVVADIGLGDMAVGRLYPRPLDAEPVVGEAGGGHEVEALAPPVVAVGRVAAGVGNRGPGWVSRCY
jgi:hypothetical protein